MSSMTNQLLKFDFQKNHKELAQVLLGVHIVTPDCRVAIVETEAYGGAEDLGSHAARGITPRNRVMFGPPGHAYVYFCYGNHWLFNITCNPEGEPGAVLVRAARPLEGQAVMTERRGGKPSTQLLSGPGKLCQALAIEGRHTGIDLLAADSPIRLEESEQVKRIVTTRRIGLAKGKGEHLEWRFVDAEHQEWASKLR